MDHDRFLAGHHAAAGAAVKDGSIHRARLSLGTVIPVHTHPADEYVMVLSGTVETGGRRCEAGTFWITPAGTRQGPHLAITDVELLTMRLEADIQRAVLVEPDL
jgi:hypothetical protein